MTTLVSNLQMSGNTYDANLVAPKAILIAKCMIWVASVTNGMVLVYKKDGCFVKSYNVTGASGLAKWGKNVLVSTTSGSIYLLDCQTDGTMEPKVTSQASFGGMTVQKNKCKHIYVANLSDSTVWVYDSSFNLVKRLRDSFLNNVGYSPVNVMNCGQDVYIVYNNKSSFMSSGYVNVYRDDNMSRLINGGNLAQPWGMAMNANSLMVGNSATGTISMFQPQTGLYSNNLSNQDGGWHVNGGITGMTYCNRDCKLYYTTTTSQGQISTIGCIDC